MGTFLRHLVVCALPLLFAGGAGYGFTRIQGSCSAMVGPIFAAKCHGKQLEFGRRFELAGAGFGTLVAATLEAWLEHRRRRAVQPPSLAGEAL